MRDQKSRQLLFYEKNKERLLPIRREYACLHKKEKTEYDKKFYLLNKGIGIKSTEEYKEERRKYAIEYRMTHRAQLAKYRRSRLKEDIQYRIANILRSRLSKVVRDRSVSAARDLGCTVSEFLQYLEKQFLPGMSWDKLGQIHIDHKIPLSRFDLTDKSQVLKAVHYTNLQPLWAEDNYKKGNKLIYA